MLDETPTGKDFSLEEVYAFPMSSAQERLWFLNRLEPGNPFYNIRLPVIHLHGRLDVSAMEHAFRKLVERHEILRTNFTEEDGVPVQIVRPDATTGLPLLDLKDLEEPKRRSILSGCERLTGQKPFDLTVDPLLRLLALRWSPDHHVLLVTMHHIISDAWSSGIFIRELRVFYGAGVSGTPARLSELEIQYADYSVWQREWLEGNDFRNKLDYWRQAMADAPPLLELPLDRPRPPVQTFPGHGIDHQVDADTLAGLNRLGQPAGLTLFMICHAALAVLLARYSNQRDLVVGTPAANRNRKEIESLIGFFINTLPLRLTLEPDLGFRGLCEQARQTDLEAFSNQDMPLERLVEALQPRRNPSYSPLFQVVFSLQNAPAEKSRLPGLRLTLAERHQATAMYDQTWILAQSAAGLAIRVEYNTDLFDSSTVRLQVRHFGNLLSRFAANPDIPWDRADFLDEGERYRLIVAWNETEAPFPDHTIHRQFEEVSHRYPESVAVCVPPGAGGDEPCCLSYGLLNRLARRWAAVLSDRGVGTETVVPLLASGTLETAIGHLAILKAGGAYLPLDPNYPRERLAVLLAEHRATWILTDASASQAGLPENLELVRLDRNIPGKDRNRSTAPETEGCPCQTAYVMYTSGSTGVPKGVTVPHRAVMRLVFGTAYCTFGRDRVFLQLAPTAFDAATFEIWGSLLHGGTLAMFPDAELSVARLGTVLAQCQVTTLWLTTSLFNLVIDEDPLVLKDVEQLMTGGEAISPRHSAKAMATLPNQALSNCYGPTENTTFTTVQRLRPPLPGAADKPLPIGKPIGNTQSYILDSHMNPTTARVGGELLIGGAGLARGYHRRPALTASSWLPNRFGPRPGTRLYRSGDRVRRDHGGAIHFLGRNDGQVKLRGFRIELGEVRANLLAHPRIKDAAVTIRPDASGRQALVAYVVWMERDENPATLTEFLARKLPGYMIPAHTHSLSALPLTPNGKVDMASLPDPWSETDSGEPDARPRDETESLVAMVWQEVLNTAPIGIHRDFFEMGGHSLLAAQAVSRLRPVFGEVPVRWLFESPTVADLAKRLKLGRDRLREDAPELRPITREGRIRLSYAQMRLWFLDRLVENDSSYAIPLVTEMKGFLDVSALAAAISNIVARHEVLRTRFPGHGGEPFQEILPFEPMQTVTVDYGAIAEIRAEPHAKLLCERFCATPFDLETGPLFRYFLVRVDPSRHWLVGVMHHMITDGWSLGLFVRELATRYRANLGSAAGALPKLPVQFGDYAEWQRRWLEAGELDRQLAFWTKHLADIPELTELPLDRPRPAILRFQGSTVPVAVPREIVAALNEACQRWKVTPFMFLSTVFAVALGKYCGQEDLCLGTPVANRTHRDLEGLIGFFANTLVLRFQLYGNPRFHEALARTRKAALDAYANQDLPFEKLVETLQPRRNLSHTPIFQTMFALQNASAERLDLPGLTLSGIQSAADTTNFDLTLSLTATSESIGGLLFYNTALFDRTTVLRLARLWLRALALFTAEPERRVSASPFIEDAERHQLLHGWNDTDHFGERQPTTVPIWFRATAAKVPDRLAVVGMKPMTGGKAMAGMEAMLTYRELSRRADILAHRLREAGVGPDRPVGVCLPRSVDLVTAMLAILLADGCYVPMDTAYPTQRLRFIAEDTQPAALLTDRTQSDRLADWAIPLVFLDDAGISSKKRKAKLPHVAGPLNLAYIIYTSGSTGTPKGVMISHGSLVHYLRWTLLAYGVGEAWGTQLHGSISFDATITSIWPELMAGRAVAVAPDGEEVPALTEALWRGQPFSLVKLTPAHLEILARQDRPAHARVKARALFSGGEQLHGEMLGFWNEHAPQSRIINEYGPTETVVGCAIYEVPKTLRHGPVPIGRPIVDMRLHLLGRFLDPVPMGAIGEIHIGGQGLGRGYFRRPSLTAQAFIPNGIGGIGARLYKTGDLARYRADGNLRYLRRVDYQVKLRGFRIECEEIEVVLRRHPAVAETLVMVRDLPDGERRLTAYVRPASVKEGEPPLSLEKVRAFLAGSLPDYMLPASLVVLDTFPVNLHGKIDRKALPSPESGKRPMPLAETAASETAQRIVSIWRELIDAETIEHHRSFFELGGHSLLLLKMQARLEESFRRPISIVELFRRPTVAALCDYFENRTEAQFQADTRRISQTGGSGDIAVVGMAFRFPGADTPTRYWENLSLGVESVVRFSEDELMAAGLTGETVRQPNFVKANPVLDRHDCFDADFFGIPPREAALMDPQHRLFLEQAWAALEHAGYVPDALKADTGIFAGAGTNTYLIQNLLADPQTAATLGYFQGALNHDKDFLPSRVAFKLNLRGPCVNVQSACSTSLVAVHLACQSLRNGECGMALAGGATVRARQITGYFFEEDMILSPDGHCRAFDAGARGTVGGSGVGVVVLKRVEDARADGDWIHTVIKGSAINNDGSLKMGFTAPSELGQAEVIRRALAAARVEPESIDYIEAHGTGTPLGDPIEIAALRRVFGKPRKDGTPHLIGSVKTNFGHLDTAAGVAGLIKTVLALEHRQVPPSLHFQSPNPNAVFGDSLRVNHRLRAWEPGEGRRRAGISSFGIGGVNAHLVVEEAPEPTVADPARPWQLLCLSAKTAESLDTAALNLAEELERKPEPNLEDVAFTLQIGRKAFDHRRALVCKDPQMAVAQLRKPPRSRDLPASAKPPRVAFMFPGQGAQYAGMGHTLYRQEDRFREEVDRCCSLLTGHLEIDPRTYLIPNESGVPEPDRELFSRTDVAQPALFTVAFALAKLWQARGVSPAATIGHSIGEYVAACLAGVFSLKDALYLVAERGRLMASMPAGAMLAVPLSESDLAPRLEGSVGLAAVNGPDRCVVSGSVEAVEKLRLALVEEGFAAKRLETSHAFHSPLMEAACAPFRQILGRVEMRPPKIPFLSNLTGDWITDREAQDPDYWVRHLRQPVRFHEGLRRLLEQDGMLVLEVGAGNGLTGFARRGLGDRGQAAVGGGLRPGPDGAERKCLLEAAGELWVQGLALDWESFYQNRRRVRVPLPTYPFERRRHWVDPPDRRPATAIATKKAPIADWFYLPRWQKASRTNVLTDPAPGIWFVNARAQADSVLERFASLGRTAITAMPGPAFARPVPNSFVVRPDSREDYAKMFGQLASEGIRPRTLVHLWCLPAGLDLASVTLLGCRALTALARALWASEEAEIYRIAIFANRLFAAVEEDRNEPEKAVLLGPATVISQEYPHLRLRCIDPGFPDPERLLSEETIKLFDAEAREDEGPPMVALRGHERYTLDYVPFHMQANTDEALSLPDNPVVMITGGLGNIGRVLAGVLAKKAGAGLVLIGRTPSSQLGEVGEAWLRDMGSKGVEALYLSADVANEAQMRDALEAAEARFGRIDGVIHAAGLVGPRSFRPLDALTADDWHDQLHAKVHGLLVLDRLLAGRDLSFRLVCSSLASALGGLGFAAYAASNHFVDAFARAHYRDSLAPWRSVNWDGWRFDGRQGMGNENALDPEEGAAAFERLLEFGEGPQILVSTWNLQTRFARWILKDSESATASPISRTPPRSEPGSESDLELDLAKRWQALLGRDRVHRDDSFFDLGGDSLLGIQLLSRVRQDYRVDLPLARFFETPTVAGLAKIIGERVPQTKDTPRNVPALPALEPAPDRGRAPLSSAQMRLWFLDRLEPDNPVYNLSAAFKLTGELSVAALEAAVLALFARHGSLRTSFSVKQGEPEQRIAESMPFRLTVTDLRGTRPDQRSLSAIATREFNRPFHLARAPLLRLQVLRLAEERWTLLIAMHHIISDGWSLGILFRELAEAYEALVHLSSPAFSEPAWQYADYAYWQDRWSARSDFAKSMAYWKERLAGMPALLDLPLDRPRPRVQSFRGDRFDFYLSQPLTSSLKRWAGQARTTLFLCLETAFAALLSRYSGQQDVAVGTPVANRARPELETIVGLFLNTLVLRHDLAGTPGFAALARTNHEKALEAFEHQEIPFERVVEALQPERNLSHSPLFQAFFIFHNTPAYRPNLPGIAVTSFPGGERVVAMYDLTLTIRESGGRLHASFEYNTDLFYATTIRNMARRWTHFLEAVMAAPETPLAELPRHDAVSRHQLLWEWNSGPSLNPSGTSIHGYFEVQVEKAPERVALVSGNRHWSYGHLDGRANRIAGDLRARGTVAEELVGVCCSRGPDLVSALLGVLKAGGAYVPLDPNLPGERLAYMLADAGSRLALCDRGCAEKLPETIATASVDRIAGTSPAMRDRPVGSNRLAYTIYTSGSTGRPKGVQVAHGAVVNFLGSMAARPGLGPGDTLLAVTTVSFDISGLELYLPLLRGARLVLAGDRQTGDGKALAALVDERYVTLMQATPATYRLMLLHGWRGSPGLTLICGGEALPGELAGRLGEKVAGLWNLYGPTETTIWSAALPVSEAETGFGTVSIGRPIANTELYVTDAHGYLANAGLPGELSIGGAGLARGYRGKPALTADRFVPHQFGGCPGLRLYRTGDVVRTRGDGCVTFLGRRDHQVKIRGFRIELGEIEAALSRLPEIRQAAVAVDRDKWGDSRLVAYLVPENTQDRAADPAAWRERLAGVLPDYMIPASFIRLSKLPLNSSGKLDRNALPKPKHEARSGSPSGAPPETELERSLSALWKEVLDLETVGRNDNFFDIGGHSMSLARVHAKLEGLLGRTVPLVQLFRYPTIRELARFLSGAASDRPFRLRAERRSGGRMDVAIIGMAARFPDAPDIDAFWENLKRGHESMRPLTEEEMLAAGASPGQIANPAYVKMGSCLQDIDLFDAAFFGIHPKEAETMDPQHRLVLEVAWEALENAGYGAVPEDNAIGVFAGSGLNTYVLYQLFGRPDALASIDPFQAWLNNDKDFLPTRISYKLNLKGPSVNVQTACSTSLVAIHWACQSLYRGESEIALAGGSSVNFRQAAGYFYQEGNIASPDGHCRAFDAEAAGTIFGSGVALAVLKPLDRALADGDHIHGVIRGSCINNDGAMKVGYTAPGLEGQASVIRGALEAAEVEAASIGYVETHGTATALGDTIEVAALARAFAQDSSGAAGCAIGSVKTNVGHLDTAAGAAGLIKTLLALRHRQIPPSLHFHKPNPKIEFAGSPFFVNDRLRDWPDREDADGKRVRRAGVSSFGIGGTNAHIILEEAPARESGPSRPITLFALSAKTVPALDRACSRMADFLNQNPDLNLADAAYTLLVGRTAFAHRRILACAGLAEAARSLESLDPEQVATGVGGEVPPGVAFLFSGHGPQHAGMARDVYRTEPVFREEADRCAEKLEPLLGLDIRTLLFVEPGDEDEPAFDEMTISQPAMFLVEYAFAKLLMHCGIQPRAMIGHSSGEYVAACLAGVFDLDDALRLVSARGRLMAALPAGAMLSISLPQERVNALLGEDLYLAAVNGAANCVVSGTPEAIEALAAKLGEDEVECRVLRINIAAHSPLVAPMIREFEQTVASIDLHAPRLPFLSNLTGTWIAGEEATDPGYWTDHLRQAVLFDQGLTRLLESDARVLVEIGPGRTLSTLARRHPRKTKEHIVIESLRHARDHHSDLSAAPTVLGRLWLAGVIVDWHAYFSRERRLRVPLPTYPFERRRFWIDARADTGSAQGLPAGKRPDMASWFYRPVWREEPLPPIPGQTEIPGVDLVFADGTNLGKALTAMLISEGRRVISVEPGAAFGAAENDAYALNPGEAKDYEELIRDLQDKGLAPKRIFHLWSLDPGGREPDRKPSTMEPHERSFLGLLFLAQAIGNRFPDTEMDLLAVAGGLHEVTGLDSLSPEKATLLGPCLVIPMEFAGISCRCIDIVLPSPGTSAEKVTARALVREAGHRSEHSVLALRGRHRMVRDFQSMRPVLNPGEPVRLRKNGVYLITGGWGGIGLTLARHLARAVEARLILTGRTPLPPESEWDAYLTDHGEDEATARYIRGIRSIEADGGEVLAVTVDVASEGGMRSVIERVRGRFGTIHGVVHAAGILGGGLIQLTDRSEMEAVFEAKVRGTLVLEKVLGDADLDFMLLCSSLTGILGGVGQVSYCGANAFLDAFAHAQTAKGRTVISVNWDAWQKVGMAVDALGEKGDLLAHGLLPEEGCAVFDSILAGGDSQVCISTRPLASLRKARVPERGRGASGPERTREQSAHERPELGTGFTAPETGLQKELAGIWQSCFGIEAIGIHDDFFELGGDSLLALRVIGKTRALFGRELPLVSLFERRTIAGQAELLEALSAVQQVEETREPDEDREEGEI